MTNSIAKGDLKGLAAALDAISSLTPEELDAQWKALYGSDPPDRLRRPLMIQALAYRLQEQALGGLKPAPVARCAASRAMPERAVRSRLAPSAESTPARC